jgi:hypothetical protein
MVINAPYKISTFFTRSGRPSDVSSGELPNYDVMPGTNGLRASLRDHSPPPAVMWTVVSIGSPTQSDIGLDCVSGSIRFQTGTGNHAIATRAAPQRRLQREDPRVISDN